MAASGDNLIFDISSMAASQRQLLICIYFRNSRLHIFYISYSDVKEERIFMNIFLTEGFSKKCKHTELALNFIQKQYFS